MKEHAILTLMHLDFRAVQKTSKKSHGNAANGVQVPDKKESSQHCRHGATVAP